MTSTTTTTTTATSPMGREVWAERLTGGVAEVLMSTETHIVVRTIWTLEEGAVTGREIRHLPREVAALVLEPLEGGVWT